MEGIVAATEPQAAASGWRFRKSGLQFSRPLCKGVTQHLLPRFTFTQQGLVCLAQPIAVTESAAVRAALKQIFGKPGSGPVHHDFNAINPVRDKRSPGLKARFDSLSVRFIDVDPPGYAPDDGYYQTEMLPDYLAELRKTAEAIAANEYETSSETAFLRALPDSYEVGGIFFGSPFGALLSFAVTRVLCGEPDVVSRLRDGLAGRIGPHEHALLEQLSATAERISPVV